MGRKKVVIKRIEDKSSRQVTFSKRRQGLIKKARDLSVLCDAHIALIFFSTHGRLYDFSTSDSVTSVVSRYRSYIIRETPTNIDFHDDDEEFCCYYGTRSLAELQQLVERNVEGPNFEQFGTTDLVQLEREFGAALIQTRSRKAHAHMDLIKELQEKQNKLTEENEKLKTELSALKKRRDMKVDHCRQVHDPPPSTRPTLDLLR